MTTAHDQRERDLTLLVWDSPNLNCTLQRLFETERLTRAQRPDSSVLRCWLRNRAGTGRSEAIVFVNTYDQSRLDGQLGWLGVLRRLGYGVFIKPKDADGNGDIDDDMIAAIHARQPMLREVIVLSQDLRNFAALATHLSGQGIIVTPLVLEGFQKWPAQTEPVDLSAIPGMFAEPVPLALGRFDDLPRTGRYFPPFDLSGRDEARPVEPMPTEPPAKGVAEATRAAAPPPIPGVSPRQLQTLAKEIAAVMADSSSDELAVSAYAPWWWDEVDLPYAADFATVIRAAISGTDLSLVESPTGPVIRRDRLATVVDLRDRQADAASG